MLQPSRHIGRIPPDCPDKMSPVISRLFTALKSMQNAQVLTSTGGVARYVVKYVTELDKGNRVVVWADSHSGAKLRVDKQFVPNTKITSSRVNQEKIQEKSREKKHDIGRAISYVEKLQMLLGYSEVKHSFDFEHIATTFRTTR